VGGTIPYFIERIEEIVSQLLQHQASAQSLILLNLVHAGMFSKKTCSMVLILLSLLGVDVPCILSPSTSAGFKPASRKQFNITFLHLIPLDVAVM
jgi:hypothetical protein